MSAVLRPSRTDQPSPAVPDGPANGAAKNSADDSPAGLRRTERGVPDPEEVVPFPVQGGPSPEDLPPAELAILVELERLRTLGVKSVDRRNLAVLAGRSPKSSSYEAHVSALRARRLLLYPAPGHLGITTAGRTVARLALGWMYDPPPHETTNPSALHEAWASYLSAPQAKILRALLERHPRAIPRGELASIVGQSPRSSSFEDHVRLLKALGVAEYPAPGTVRAAPLLFPDDSP